MLQKHKCVMGLHMLHETYKTQPQQYPQNSFKTPDDDQLWPKNVVYNIVLNRFKRLIVYM
jgi:hypothetical protein